MAIGFVLSFTAAGLSLLTAPVPARADSITPTPTWNIQSAGITPVGIDSAGNVYAVPEEDYYVHVYDASNNYALD